jgi:hypothetical protein
MLAELFQLYTRVLLPDARYNNPESFCKIILLLRTLNREITGFSSRLIIPETIPRIPA